MKNCDPLVLGPAFAIDNNPGYGEDTITWMHECKKDVLVVEVWRRCDSRGVAKVC